MHLNLTEEQQAIARMARDYADRVLIPRASARDASGTFPTEELKALAKLGLLGIAIPSRYGGSGSDAVACSLAIQELARGDASVSVAVSVTNMVAELICLVGTEEQSHTHVSKLISGEYLTGGFALSEPESGSDASALQTQATQTADGWRLSGTKQWVTNGGHCGILVVWAKTDKSAGHKGITCFLVRGDAPGVTVSGYESKMGLRGSATAQIVLDDVAVSHADVLGEIGCGFTLAMRALDGGRIGIASQAVGIAQAAIDAAVTYAKGRVAFGKPIAKHQAVGNMLADVGTAIEAARLMALRAAWLKQTGKPFSKQASMAKLFASEHACKACDVAIQVHGGYGYTSDFPVERMFRDARVTRIYEGTSEIQRIVIARSLMKEAGL